MNKMMGASGGFGMWKWVCILVLCVLIAACSGAGQVQNPPDQAPEMEWHKGQGTPRGDHVHYGLQTSDGGYIMVGQTVDGVGEYASDMLVVKTDGPSASASGRRIWSARYRSTHAHVCRWAKKSLTASSATRSAGLPLAPNAA